MGSARAPRAVFRALAENLERTKKFRVFGKRPCAKRLDAKRPTTLPRRLFPTTTALPPAPAIGAHPPRPCRRNGWLAGRGRCLRRRGNAGCHANAPRGFEENVRRGLLVLHHFARHHRLEQVADFQMLQHLRDDRLRAAGSHRHGNFPEVGPGHLHDFVNGSHPGHQRQIGVFLFVRHRNVIQRPPLLRLRASSKCRAKARRPRHKNGLRENAGRAGSSPSATRANAGAWYRPGCRHSQK